MAALSRSSASWERVLAAMEADAARAAALLISDDASVTAGIAYDGHDAAPTLSSSPDEAAGVPATWRLPVPASGSSAGAGLTGGAAARAVAGYAAAAAGIATPSAATSTTSTVAPTAQQPTDPPAAAAPGGSSALPNSETPTAEVEPFELPDPADMPPLTAEQQERLTSLQARITALQSELAAAMTEAETVLARPVARRPGPQPRPELVDRRL